ncbi:F-box/kelch-repeat protein At1g23390 [Olea europaea var. sylvestris]|uniref:F-box/kelch-repeat protein At1g23390 n=1 Tax=Olea europaea var. sylvestris TaxID=158386 RepID=UPI000C1D716B|nr:F-box/kelch-repeat protein At1g23390 [Olea europaea var. sylvestris]
MARKEIRLSSHEDEEVEIHGDVLEVVLSYVPLIDLVPASNVSKSWRSAVASSLRHLKKLKPWLILHKQSTYSPYASITYTYDPCSNQWIKVSMPSMNFFSTLKSSQSNFLYMMSSSKFSFSFDPLNSTWCHVAPPLVWRTDPIVARVGDSVVIAGGVCQFEDDPLAVEVYDFNTRAWCTCESMPESLKESAASAWLSVATTKGKLIVTEKKTGVTHWFDSETKSWSGQFNLNPGQPVVNYYIGSYEEDLILVGFCNNVEQFKIWKVSAENFYCEQIGEMPLAFVEKLKSECFGFSSINVLVARNFVYMYNSWEVEEMVVCELTSGGGGIGSCRWWSVPNVVCRDGMLKDRLVFTCSEVGFDELHRVMKMDNWKFEVVST